MRAYRSSLSWILVMFFAVASFGCGGGGGDSAGPPPAPTVTTTPATGIGTDNAILNGTVNPNAQATNAWLEWGTDNTLSSFTATATQAIGAGTTAQAVSATITGLTSGTKYYYRAAATNASGTQKGVITSLTTAAPNSPPTVTTSAATSVTITGATLNGTVLPNELATTGWFEWGTDSNLVTYTSTASQSLGSGKTSVPITATLSLSAGTTYYFRVAATNSVGTSKGSILTFNTVAQPPTVTTAAATSLTTNSATLNGNVNPNGLATTAFFEYGTDNTMGVITTTTSQNMGSGTTGQSLTAPISSLSPATRYYFRVSATNSAPAGTSKGAIVFLDTQNPPPTANAGPDQTVFQGFPVTLDGSGSTDVLGGTITYQWTQVAGTSVTLTNPTTVNPTFTAPTVSYPGDNLVFQLTVTSSRGPTATDNVRITDKWGFFDDFSTDTTIGYDFTLAWGTLGTFRYDSVGKRVEVTTGQTNGVMFSHVLPTSSQGVFSIDFSPTLAIWPTHGGFWIRLKLNDSNYYEVSNFDYTPDDGSDLPPFPDKAAVRKYVGGSLVQEVLYPMGYTQGSTYNIKITYSPTKTTMVAFGQTIDLTANVAGISVSSVEVLTGQQNAYYDNIKLEARP